MGAWQPSTSEETLTGIGTAIQYFSPQQINDDQKVHHSVRITWSDVNDDAIVSVHGTLQDDDSAWSDVEFDSVVVTRPASPGSRRIDLVVSDVYRYRIGVRARNAADSLTARETRRESSAA